MKPILLLNGPNLNLLGIREPGLYGQQSFEDYFDTLTQQFPEATLQYRQSNVEGELINLLHEWGFHAAGIIFNPGGYSHTSVALRDAVAAIPAPVVEVHISNIFSREPFRHHSHISAVSKGVISGFGLYGYELALRYLLQHTN